MKLLLLFCLLLAPAMAVAESAPLVFGDGGQIKMLYDRRQRPQSVYLNGKVYLVYNGDGEKGAEPKAKTKPMVITYDPSTRTFSDSVALGPGDKDHHYGPVIWADSEDYLHILFGCHKTPGTHLISKQPAATGSSVEAWREGSEIAPSISYPTFHRISDGRQVIYYRTEGHISSWTYRISEDNGNTWKGPETPVTDMDIKGRFEWSSYQACLPSKDGKSLHVAFTSYDDNRDNQDERYFNPRYGHKVSNGWKYNLYYVALHENQWVCGDAFSEGWGPSLKCNLRIWSAFWLALSA